MTVAILGTGKMGAAMARRLSEQGFPLVLWNRTPERIPADIGAKVALSPAEAAYRAEIVISSLTDPAAVRDVYLGKYGAALAGGRLFIEMSTAGPEAVLELQPAISANGSRMIDAPVLGSIDAVLAGTLEILVGGAAADVAAAEPVLRSLGTVHQVGPLGSGARLKLISNAMLGGSLALASELQRLGTAVGLDPTDVWSALATRFPYLGAQEEAFVGHQHDHVNFALRDLVKDLDLAAGLEKETGTAAPIVDQVRRVYDAAPPELQRLSVTAILEAAKNGAEPSQAPSPTTVESR
jgi:3-hydroxyisobutyrate dehydrogenase-like beta-hydroxyacid dehydrogenase